MAFKKTGSPENTVGVLKQDGTAALFCGSCASMTESSMDRKAFSGCKNAASHCRKCGTPL